MEKPVISTAFYLKLLEFLFSAKHQMMALGANFGLTSIQVVTLLMIDEKKPRPMKSFCSLYNCDASNLTGIVDGLERKGLVSRQNDPKDRRLKIICLEESGKKLQAKILQTLAKSDGFLFDPLSKTEAEQFVHIIEKLAAHNVSLSNI